MYRIPLALVALVLIALGIFLYFDKQPDYTSAAYGISFSYPDGYVLTEGERYLHLVRKEDAVPPVNGEGPTGITVDLYPAATASLLDWVTNSKASNFNLGDKVSTAVTVGGVPALHYRWSGLYEGETTAFEHNGNILAVSVTRLSPSDHTQAYEEVLSSLKLK